DGTRTEAVEAQLMTPTGIVESYVGRIDGLRVELVTDKVLRSGTAKDVAEGHRLYGIVDRALLYAFEMAAVGEPLRPHLSAKLDRVAG
ncbi:MAG TPA: heme-binding beta-barrel domain-containing protein, partial [Micromonosporaceae bacterium]|nr:heme-binding beta-barrel domain-containing protein [Micromonosporaceae bacterium]